MLIDLVSQRNLNMSTVYNLIPICSSKKDSNDYLNQIIYQITKLRDTRTHQQAGTHNQPEHRGTGTKAAEDPDTPG